MKTIAPVAVVVLALLAGVFAHVPGGGRAGALAGAPGTGIRPNDAAAAALASTGTLATTTCSYPFTSGSNTGPKQFLQYCVTVNGNIVEFQSPLGIEHIAEGIIGEGYAICDGYTFAEYEDYAGYGASNNWDPAILLSLTSTALKIARTTSAGVWTLIQTITQNAADASANIAMILKNNSSVARYVLLIRVVDIDANNANHNFLDIGDGTSNTTFSYDFSQGLGLQLSLTAQNSYNHTGWAENKVDSACAADGSGGPLVYVDTVNYLSNQATIGAGKTMTVKMKYKSM